MFETLEQINQRPKPYEFYTAAELWNDAYVSKKMLEYHLDETQDLASKNPVFINKVVDWIDSRFKINGMKICDFGCGPGLYTTRFAKKGADVTGIDFSERSITYAKNIASQKNLKIDYILENYLEFTTNQTFDLITMVYYDLCPLSPAQRKILFAKFYKYLKNDGYLILDVLSMNYFDSIREKNTYEYIAENGFWSANPYYAFLNTFKYENEELLLHKYTLFEKNRTRKIYNWLQCYHLESLKNEFQENGFQIIEHYSDISGTSYNPQSTEIAVVAQKMASYQN